MINRRETILALGAGLLINPTRGLALSAPLNVVATTGMIADLIQNVGGYLDRPLDYLKRRGAA